MIITCVHLHCLQYKYVLYRVAMAVVPSSSGQQEMEESSMTLVLLMGMLRASTPSQWALLTRMVNKLTTTSRVPPRWL